MAAPTRLAWADHDPPGGEPFREVAFDQKLNAQVPLEAIFVDERGQAVRLGKFLGQKPVVLLFAYYECPMLCTLVLNDLVKAMKELRFDLGEQFEVVTVSVDPSETPELAAEKKATYLKEYGRPGAGQGWHFLTGEQAEIDRLAETVGYQYYYDETIEQYAHPTGLVILTPDGKVSRYLLGIGYSALDLRMGLVEASGRKIGEPVDQFYLLCYSYDPVHGEYTLAVQNFIRLASGIFVAGMGFLLFSLIRSDRRSARQNPPVQQPSGGIKNG